MRLQNLYECTHFQMLFFKDQTGGNNCKEAHIAYIMLLAET